MRRFQACVSGFLLAVTATAWAGVEPYPEAVMGQAAPSRTRAEVVAELQQAILAGQMFDEPYLYRDRQAYARAGNPVAGDSWAEEPAVISADGTVIVWGNARLMRAKIQAEAAEANRLGLLSFAEGDPPLATAEQEQLIAAAGRRAVANVSVIGLL